MNSQKLVQMLRQEVARENSGEEKVSQNIQVGPPGGVPEAEGGAWTCSKSHGGGGQVPLNRRE